MMDDDEAAWLLDVVRAAAQSPHAQNLPPTEANQLDAHFTELEASLAPHSLDWMLCHVTMVQAHLASQLSYGELVLRSNKSFEKC